ncbi:MAG: sigma-54 dependent transcriptional regulator [Planctomycetia bacterium]
MPAETAIVADVWREACRHIEIETAAAAIARSLAPRLPIRAILVLRADAAARSVETLAVGAARDSFKAAPRTGELAATAWQKLLKWLRTGRVVAVASGEDSWLRSSLPEGLDGPLLVGALRTASGALGMVVLVATAAETFSAADIETAERLLEPLAVALDNHSRLHELRSLREAAEADRQTLLSRLGRQDVNEEVVGARTGLRHVMERAELVAQSDVPVLILGETGTGKEVVSRAIHTRSKRADGPFIRVNCGAIPPELVDSQLFGHEKGSFTGASGQHQGWFERADRGTLFLDEIGELPLPAQVRLLRVLQDHQIERVGGKSAVHVDVRIVAATHRDLATMVKDRTFREDLWYRINVFPILLPQLRERLEDIPALARHFAQRAATRFGLPYVEPTESDLRLLTSYHWPGNIRELGAVIDRAAILGGGRTLDVDVALGLSRQQAAPALPPSEATLYEVIPETVPLVAQSPPPLSGDIVPLAAAMRQHIERALAATRGRIEGQRGAAALLDINPHTLRARMRKLGIDATRYRE